MLQIFLFALVRVDFGFERDAFVLFAVQFVVPLFQFLLHLLTLPLQLTEQFVVGRRRLSFWNGRSGWNRNEIETLVVTRSVQFVSHLSQLVFERLNVRVLKREENLPGDESLSFSALNLFRSFLVFADQQLISTRFFFSQRSFFFQFGTPKRFDTFHRCIQLLFGLT